MAGRKTCGPTAGCGHPGAMGTMSLLESWVFSFAEFWGRSGHPGQGPPYAVGLGWVRGCRWELHSLVPSEAPGTWQHGSSSAPSVLHCTGSCRKHSIFRIWGSLEQQGGGGPRPEAAVAAATGPEFQEGRGAGWASVPASTGLQSRELMGASLLHGQSCRHQAPTARALH